MNTFERRIWHQIVSEGKKDWSTKDSAGNVDRFQIEFVEPLQNFQSRGFIQIEPHNGSYRGRLLIDKIWLRGDQSFPPDGPP